MLTLYQYPGAGGVSSVSPPCMKVELALRMLGAEFRVENVSPMSVSRVSVTGRLPVLGIGGERVPDSIAILDRLEREFPDAALWPRDPARRVRDRLWDHFGTDSVYWLGYYLRWIDAVGAPQTDRALFGHRPWYLRLTIRMTFLRRQRLRGMLHGVGGKPPEMIREEIARALDMMASGLEDGPFLQARDHPGRGDLACVSLLSQVGFRDTLTEILAMVRARPTLVEWCRRVLDAAGMDGPRWLRPEAARAARR